MKRLFLLWPILFLAALSIQARDHGKWVNRYSGRPASNTYLQAVGGNCLLYFPSAEADTVFAFDTYSHQWHTRPFHPSANSAHVLAGENGAMIWNDSLLILFDALHGTFHALAYAGQLVHTASPPNNLPGSKGSISYVLTTQNLYVFDHLSQTWAHYGYTRPGTGTNYQYAAFAKPDYLTVAVTNQSTGESVLLAFSKTRRTFETIGSTNLQWKILDHGFACWVNSGIAEDQYFFTMYSADHGFFETVKPNRFFDVYVNEDESSLCIESTVFMADYYVPDASGPGGTRYNFAGDTRHGSFWSNHYADSYGGTGTTHDKTRTGFEAGVFTVKDIPNYDITAYFYDGTANDLMTGGKSAIHADTPEHGFYAGSSYYTGFDTYHFIFNNMARSHQQTIELPPPTEGYENPTSFHLNAHWGVATCHRALTETIRIYSFNTLSDSVRTLEIPYSSSDFETMKARYYAYTSQPYNQAKKISLYQPLSDSWLTLPLAADGKWFFGEDFVCTYDKSDGHLKIHDVSANRDLAFALGWQSAYDFNRHTFGRDKFYLAYNTEGHYLGFSAYTRDIKEFAANYAGSFLSKPGACQVALIAYGRDFLAYNAKFNSFAPLHLSDEQGNAFLTFAGDSVLLIVTQNGHLLAFDPNVETTGIETGRPESPLFLRTFDLLPLYPNPFNASTRIRLRVYRALRLRVAVYNARGQLVTRLSDALRPKGTYELKWNATGYASGLYFVQVKAGDRVRVEKVLLLK